MTINHTISWKMNRSQHLRLRTAACALHACAAPTMRLILGAIGLSEWCGMRLMLEEDMALANMGL
jgi:hypothetical protein